MCGKWAWTSRTMLKPSPPAPRERSDDYRVGLQFAHQAPCYLFVLCFADDGEIRLGIDDQFDALADDRMVVHDEHSVHFLLQSGQRHIRMASRASWIPDPTISRQPPLRLARVRPTAKL